MNSPAPVSNSSDNETCRMTRVFPSPKRDLPPLALLDSLRAGVKSMRVALKAGASPNKIPVAIETAAVNART